MRKARRFGYDKISCQNEATPNQVDWHGLTNDLIESHTLMSHDTYTMLLRGFDVLIEPSEDVDSYHVTVSEGGSVGWGWTSR